MEPNDLLPCALQLLGRIAIPPEHIRDIIGGKKKQLEAFNLCDGTRTLKEIAKKAGIDQGNFSRTVDRWKAHGIVFSIREGRESRILHVYPLSPE